MAQKHEMGEVLPSAELVPGVASSQVERANSADLKETPQNEKANSRMGLKARLSSSFRKIKGDAENDEPTEDCSEKKNQSKVRSSNITRTFSKLTSIRKKDTHSSEKNGSEGTTAAGVTTGQNCESRSSEQKIVSVMEVNELIEQKQLQEAFSNIKTMEHELVEERKSNASRGSSTDHHKRVKDVEILYKKLLIEMKTIIKDTLNKPTIDEALLTFVVHVINEEVAAHGTDCQELASAQPDSLGTPIKWKHIWEETVEQSVTERINSVTLPSGENMCLALHLGFLRKLIKEDLLKVKCSVSKYYPEDYKVCDTYTLAYHRMVSRHLQSNILSKDLVFKDVYAVLDWVINTYKSETLMGDDELKPEVNTEILGPLLDTDVLAKLESDYLTSLKNTIQTYMNNYEKAQKNNWKSEKEPEMEILDGVYNSALYIDIQEMIGQHVIESRNLSEHLERETLRVCLQELQQLIPRLAAQFTEWDQAKASSSFMKYFVSYINGLCRFRRKLKEIDPVDSRELESTIIAATEKLKQHFFQKLKQQTQPHFQKLLTKKWILCSKAFQKIMKAVSDFLKELNHLGLPSVECPTNDRPFQCEETCPPPSIISTNCTCKADFLSEVHKYLVKEYIGQIMKQRLRLKRANRAEAGRKMKKEAVHINSKITELGSNSDWLCPAVLHISEIIGVKKDDSVKENLTQLLHKYPDMSTEHVSAILYLQGMGRQRKMSMLHFFKELKKDNGDVPNEGRGIFAEVEVPTQVQCLPFYN